MLLPKLCNLYLYLLF
uniref:Uncharacterized protein n=1 Tax=Anguilla anguilla TaxID=7936 RepID=A0A0E9UPE2_ANGAN